MPAKFIQLSFEQVIGLDYWNFEHEHCARCGKTVFPFDVRKKFCIPYAHQIIGHHVTRRPEKIISVCPSCHGQIHGKPYDLKFVGEDQ